MVIGMRYRRVGLLILLVSVFYSYAEAQFEIKTEKFNPNKKYGEDISYIDRSAFYSPDYFNSKQRITYMPEYLIASGFSVKYDVFNYKLSFQKVEDQYYLYVDFLSMKPNLNLIGVDSTIFEFKNGLKLAIPVTMSAYKLDIKSFNNNVWTSYSIRSAISKTQLEIFTNTQLLSISQDFKNMGTIKASVIDSNSYYLAMSAIYFLFNTKVSKSKVADLFINSNCFKYNNSKWDY